MLVSVFSTAPMAQCGSGSVNESILLKMSEIPVQAEWKIRVRKTREVAVLIATLTPKQLDSVDRRVIDLIASSLKDENNGVRLWAAAALEELGYRAEPALPALEAAYKVTIDRPVGDSGILPSTSASAQIRGAIDSIKDAVSEHRKQASH
jgi:hypothetical protein